MQDDKSSNAAVFIKGGGRVKEVTPTVLAGRITISDRVKLHGHPNWAVQNTV